MVDRQGNKFNKRHEQYCTISRVDVTTNNIHIFLKRPIQKFITFKAYIKNDDRKNDENEVSV